LGNQTTGQKLVGSLLIEPPILVLADDGPLVFETVEDAQMYLEPVDVLGGEYRAYDALGRALCLSTRKETRGRLLRSEVTVTQIFLRDNEPKAGELLDEISKWIGKYYPERQKEMGKTLQQAIQNLVEWFGYRK
jgi:hypothetical protein